MASPNVWMTRYYLTHDVLSHECLIFTNTNQLILTVYFVLLREVIKYVIENSFM